MSRPVRILTSYKRGEVLIGSVVEDAETGKMFVQVKVTTKDIKETLERPVPSGDQDEGEMIMAEMMDEQFRRLHGRQAKARKS